MSAADIAARKTALRLQARERRAMAYRATGAQISAKLREFLPALNLRAKALVAGYCARGSELDPLPLLKALHDGGHKLALPAATAKNEPLVFRAWKPGDPLVPDAVGASAPFAGAPEVAPDVLLVPLLAFDGRGRRLGTGAGFYDRTLARLRAINPDLLALGVAFAAQQEHDLPAEPHDADLDAILTERGVLWFKRREA